MLLIIEFRVYYILIVLTYQYRIITTIYYWDYCMILYGSWLVVTQRFTLVRPCMAYLVAFGCTTRSLDLQRVRSLIWVWLSDFVDLVLQETLIFDGQRPTGLLPHVSFTPSERVSFLLPKIRTFAGKIHFFALELPDFWWIQHFFAAEMHNFLLLSMATEVLHPRPNRLHLSSWPFAGSSLSALAGAGRLGWTAEGWRWLFPVVPASCFLKRPLWVVSNRRRLFPSTATWNPRRRSWQFLVWHPTMLGGFPHMHTHTHPHTHTHAHTRTHTYARYIL